MNRIFCIKIVDLSLLFRNSGSCSLLCALLFSRSLFGSGSFLGRFRLCFNNLDGRCIGSNKLCKF